MRCARRSRTKLVPVDVGLLSRLLSRLVRPTPPPWGLGIGFAAVLIVAETLLVYPLRRVMTPFYRA